MPYWRYSMQKNRNGNTGGYFVHQVWFLRSACRIERWNDCFRRMRLVHQMQIRRKTDTDGPLVKRRRDATVSKRSRTDGSQRLPLSENREMGRHLHGERH